MKISFVRRDTSEPGAPRTDFLTKLGEAIARRNELIANIGEATGPEKRVMLCELIALSDTVKDLQLQRDNLVDAYMDSLR